MATDVARSSDTATYGVQIIARVLGITPRRVQQLGKEGTFPTAGRGKYPLVACVQAYIKYWQVRAEGRSRDAELSALDAARVRKTQAAAGLAELELARVRGDLIPVAVHEERVGALCAELAAICKGGLGRYLGDVQRAMTPADAAALLERIGDEMLRALAGTADEIEDRVEREHPKDGGGDGTRDHVA